ncbi:hypothetical protein AS149_31905 [Burkholderia cenocepacia]|nr:hypothetical protein AS149_31905 [Burkholderia cenocepacia]
MTHAATPDVMALAWDAVCQAWLYRWAGIILVGALPAVLAALFPRLSVNRLFQEARSFAALLGLLQCVLATPLVLDTIQVGAESLDSLVSETCVVTEPSDAKGRVVMDCSGAAATSAFSVAQEIRPGDVVALRRLKTSGIPVVAEKI